MTEKAPVALPVKIVAKKEVDGLEMGVLSDGRSYLSGRGLGRLCGHSDGAMINRHASAWNSGARDSKFAKFLMSKVFDRQSLFIPLEKEHAYTDDICALFLEYY